MSWWEGVSQTIGAGVDGAVRIYEAQTRLEEAENRAPRPDPDRDPTLNNSGRADAEPQVFGMPQSTVLLFFGGMLALGLFLQR